MKKYCLKSLDKEIELTTEVFEKIQEIISTKIPVDDIYLTINKDCIKIEQNTQDFRDFITDFNDTPIEKYLKELGDENPIIISLFATYNKTDKINMTIDNIEDNITIDTLDNISVLDRFVPIRINVL